MAIEVSPTPQDEICVPPSGIMCQAGQRYGNKIVPSDDKAKGLIDATRPYVLDAVIAGHDRDEIGVLLFLNESACRKARDLAPEDDVWSDPGVITVLRQLIAAYNRTAGGSSQRIAHFKIERTLPSPALGEITDKG